MHDSRYEARKVRAVGSLISHHLDIWHTCDAGFIVMALSRLYGADLTYGEALEIASRLL